MCLIVLPRAVAGSFVASLSSLQRAANGQYRSGSPEETVPDREVYEVNHKRTFQLFWKWELLVWC